MDFIGSEGREKTVYTAEVVSEYLLPSSNWQEPPAIGSAWDARAGRRRQPPQALHFRRSRCGPHIPSFGTLFDATAVIPIFGFIKAGRDVSRQEPLGQALTAEGLDISMQVRTQLERQLAALSLEVGPHVTGRSRLRTFTQYASPKDLPRGGPTQQFVDTSIFYGFLATSNASDYRPYVCVKMQVLAADTHAVLYRKGFFANFTTVGTDAIKVEVPASTATWADLAALQADIPGASAAFKDIAALVAKDIAKQLKIVLPLGTK